MTLALIDGDIVAFRCAATCENEDHQFIPQSRTNEMVEQILGDTNASEYRIYLTGRGNFRKQIYPLYKANRVKPPPKWLVAMRDFLVGEWDALVVHGREADDQLGIEATRDGGIVCSIDKDLLQIPGTHYNFVRKEKIDVTPARAIRDFYTSMLVGDATDNIKGCPGIGKAKAPRLLEGCETEEELFEAVRAAYGDDQLMLLNGKLLWIWRKENDIWTHPKLEQTGHIEPALEVSSESTLPTAVGSIPSTAAGITK